MREAVSAATCAGSALAVGPSAEKHLPLGAHAPVRGREEGWRGKRRPTCFVELSLRGGGSEGPRGLACSIPHVYAHAHVTSCGVLTALSTVALLQESPPSTLLTCAWWDTVIPPGLSLGDQAEGLAAGPGQDSRQVWKDPTPQPQPLHDSGSLASAVSRLQAPGSELGCGLSGMEP